jgi:hypothetical protein
MTDLRCTMRHRDGRVSAVDVTVSVEPSRWTAEDAKHFLWDLIRQLDAHGVYRGGLLPGSSPVQWILEVETDTGKVITQPLVLSTMALIWLERCRLTLPENRSVY